MSSHENGRLGPKPPNYEWYANLPYWTAHDLAALSLGCDPAWPGWSLVDDARDWGTLANYPKRKLLVERAQHMGELDERIRPADAVAWDDGGRMGLPQELVTAVSAAPNRPNYPAENAGEKSWLLLSSRSWRRRT
jgi:hypothetical protein